MVLELRDTAVGSVGSHALRQVPLIEGRVRSVDVLLVESRDTAARVTLNAPIQE